MTLDLNLLDTGFAELGDAWSPGELLQVLGRPQVNYVMVGPRLLARRALIERALADAEFGEARQRYWTHLLEREPRWLAWLLAQRAEEVVERVDQPDPPPLDAAGLSIAEHILLDALSAAPQVPRIDAERIAPEHWPDLAIVLDDGVTRGIFDQRVLEPETAWRGGALLQPPPIVPPPPELEPAASGEPPSLEGSGVVLSPLRPEPFEAHPRLSPEGPMHAGQRGAFRVGFGDSADPDADEQKRIRIEDPRPGETLLVVVSAEGGRIVGDWFAELPLQVAAEHRFEVEATADASALVLRAQYLFRHRPVGCIAKTVPLESAREPILASIRQPAQDRAHELAPLDAQAPVDLVLWVQRGAPEHLEIKARVAATATMHGPWTVRVEDPQHFARDLAALRAVHGDTGTGARDELVVIGRAIAGLLPEALIRDVLAPAWAGGAVPSMLLYTDEPFIPWELARIGKKYSGRDVPAFLGELARVGRWWSGRSAAGPLSSLVLGPISALAAQEYSLASNRAPLEHAVAEREALRTAYHAQPIEALRADVDAWLDAEPRRSGHLAHIALHGFSDALPAGQGLVLGDGALLTPARLAGEWDEGDTPRFTMVFLNACQVGSAAERLGALAGFPGALTAGGASAFVAPLWEVQDKVALEVSLGFYRRTLKEHVEVGEALRAERAASPPERSITPWAYVYYGHPRLQLQRHEAFEGGGT